MIIELEQSGKNYQVKLLSAQDAIDIARVLAEHDLLFLTEKEEHVVYMVVGLLKLTKSEFSDLAAKLTKGLTLVATSETQSQPVSILNFNGKPSDFLQLLAKILHVNFSELSIFLLAEKERVEKMQVATKAS